MHHLTIISQALESSCFLMCFENIHSFNESIEKNPIPVNIWVTSIFNTLSLALCVRTNLHILLAVAIAVVNVDFSFQKLKNASQ